MRQTKSNVNRKARATIQPGLSRFRFVESAEPVESVLGQFPVNERVSILEILAAYDAEDKKLSCCLRWATTTQEIVDAFLKCPCGCYAGAKKYLSDKEQGWLVALIARYLLLVTESKELTLLSKLPQELKRRSWKSLPKPEQARLQQMGQKGGVER